MSQQSGGRPKTMVVPITLTVLFFLLDLSLPLGIAAGVPYVAVILSTLWIPGPASTLIFGILCSAVTVLVAFFPVSEAFTPVVLANRGLALFAIWVTTILSIQRKRFERKLEAGRRLYQSLYEDAPLAYFTVDPQGRIRMVNSAASELLGCSRQELIGRPVLDCYAEGPQGREKARALRRRFQAGKPISGETVQMQRKDGSLLWVSLTVRPIRSPDGAVLESRSIVQDITPLREAQKLAEKTEEYNQAIVNTVIDGIITIDEAGTVQTFNPAAARMFGYQPQEVIGRNVRILMPEPDSSRHDQYLQHYLKTSEARIIGIGREVTAQKKDGTRFPVHLGVAEMHVGEHRKFVGTIRDLTRYKEMESELHWTREYAALGEMATSIAHQIKNPLAAVNGVLKVLLDADGIARQHRSIVEELVQRVSALDNLVRRLFVFAKPWNPKMKTVDLRELAVQVAASAQREATFSAIRFEFTGEEELIGTVDPLLVQDLIWNILYNAAHAMPEGGKIGMHFARRDKELCLSVTDTGPGIPREVMEKLFRPFFTTKHQGTGLGLSICRKIVRAHGGSIAVDNGLGEGTRVSIRFPVSQMHKSSLQPYVH